MTSAEMNSWLSHFETFKTTSKATGSSFNVLYCQNNVILDKLNTFYINNILPQSHKLIKDTL